MQIIVQHAYKVLLQQVYDIKEHHRPCRAVAAADQNWPARRRRHNDVGAGLYFRVNFVSAPKCRWTVRQEDKWVIFVRLWCSVDSLSVLLLPVNRCVPLMAVFILLVMTFPAGIIRIQLNKICNHHNRNDNSIAVLCKVMWCNVMQVLENLSAPTKATSGRPACSLAQYQIKSAIARLLFSFRCQVKVRKDQSEEMEWC